MNASLKSVRHYAEYLALSGIVRALALPRGAAARELGSTLGRAVASTGVRRAVVSENLRIAFPEKSEPERAAIERGCYEHFGRIIVDTARFPEWTDAEIRERVVMENRAHLDEALAAGRGALIATGHIGCYDVGAPRISMEIAPVTSVYQGVRNPYIEEWIVRIRCQRGARVAKRGMGFRKVYAALKRNECVAILADQDAGSSGLFIPFFGRDASTLSGPAEFALRTGAALLTAFAPVEGERYTVRFEPVIPHSDVETMMREYNRRLEAAIRRRPEQYFWLHKRWKTRPPREHA